METYREVALLVGLAVITGGVLWLIVKGVEAGQRSLNQTRAQFDARQRERLRAQYRDSAERQALVTALRESHAIEEERAANLALRAYGERTGDPYLSQEVAAVHREQEERRLAELAQEALAQAEEERELKRRSDPRDGDLELEPYSARPSHMAHWTEDMWRNFQLAQLFGPSASRAPDFRPDKWKPPVDGFTVCLRCGERLRNRADSRRRHDAKHAAE